MPDSEGLDMKVWLTDKCLDDNQAAGSKFVERTGCRTTAITGRDYFKVDTIPDHESFKKAIEELGLTLG